MNPVAYLLLRSMKRPDNPGMRLLTRHGSLDLSGPPVVMGILNVTPDSFSDGGKYVAVEAASRRASRMIEEGAAVIDVGPESSRPGAAAVVPQEQMRRAVPAIEAIRRHHTDVVISIDTTSAEVASAALRAGADLINDISALRGDPQMTALAAETGAPLILMHMLGTPSTMQQNPHYTDVVAEVRQFLAERVEFAVAAGVARSRIVIDPGIGFGKTAAHNCELMRRLDELATLGPPVLLGASRKSVVRGFVGSETTALVAGSLMCALAGAMAGAKILRVHDVRETVHLVRGAPVFFVTQADCRHGRGAGGATGVCGRP